MRYRRLIPLFNIILFILLVSYVYLYMVPRYKYTSYYQIVHIVALISIVGVGITVVISAILFWLRVGEREENQAEDILGIRTSGIDSSNSSGKGNGLHNMI